jgi:hypothetical protein
MALTSPGVQVTVTDESQYLPAPTNSVPLVVLATAQNKADPTGTGVAQATTAANAGKLYQVTSQRDLVSLYGTPFFYTTSNGTPIQGYELNEYGLLAAYSLLGVTNRCYVLRADIDLASLVGQTGRPTGAPADGTWWLDTTNSTWGIFSFNQTTGQFTSQNPIVITDLQYLTGGVATGVPVASLGNVGQYAVVAIQPTTLNPVSASTYYYKTTANEWVVAGSVDWLGDIPTVTGTASNPTLTAGNQFGIGVDGYFSATITVPNSPNNTIAGVANAINALGYADIKAAVRSGKLCIFSEQTENSPVASDYIVISQISAYTVLTDMGISAGTYRQPALSYGTSAQMPLWQASQAQPRPTGSVWIKVGASGNGLNPVVSQYSSATASWKAKSVALGTSDWEVNSTLDSTGGKMIPAGTVYAQYFYDNYYNLAPIYLWERIATGPTVVTGTETTVSTPGGDVFVTVSLPGEPTINNGGYTVSVTASGDATDFVTAWTSANIPYTTATVTTSGAVQITHTAGGAIQLTDFSDNLGALGLVAGVTTGVKYGEGISIPYRVTQTSTTGSGTGAHISLTSLYGEYYLDGDGIASGDGGSGYAVGDSITIAGTSLGGTTPANDLIVKVASVSGGAITSVTFVSGTAQVYLTTVFSNWVSFDYTANEGAPVAIPANNTNWFFSVVDQVDIMVNYGGNWKGYRNQQYDLNGFPMTGSGNTDPNGPIVSPSEPTTQSDGTALVYGDLWINTTDLENYPVINRWQSVNNVDQWVTLNNADQTSSTGVLFADARWATTGDVNPANDPIPSITSLLTSNYLDIDAPSSSLYPNGMLIFNTRRSGYNVKRYAVNYFNSASFPNDDIPAQTDAWVSESGLQANGAPYMGRKAQRNMVVKALRSVIDTNTDIRDEDNFFNLMATPNYPELQPNMVVLNADRGETGYIIGDTPMRLSDSATDIQAWATNAAGAEATGEDGLVTRNTYLGLFYPSGITSDLSGNLVAVPASHMMLRTFLRNDTISYPWLAAAGTRRGTIDNATNIGYIDSTTGEFITIKTRLGIRDVLYINEINPLVFFTGIGLLNYGNKNSFNSSSALDRTNVSRLVAYIRRQLTLAGRPFVFEPNDQLTRQQFTGVVQSLMVDLVAKRGLYDYLVVCDDSNNTPARIDRNELWCDVAIEPVKAAEFIYIPVRILNTGASLK